MKPNPAVRDSSANRPAADVAGDPGDDRLGPAPIGVGQPPLELERFMPYRLSVLSKRISSALAHEYETRFGVSIPQWRVIIVLGRHQPLSASEVAEQTRMDKAKVSRTIAALERDGLLQRTIDPADLRMVSLRLTPEGESVHHAIAAMALAWERRLLECLHPPALAGLDSALASLEEQIRHLVPAEAVEP